MLVWISYDTACNYDNDDDDDDDEGDGEDGGEEVDQDDDDDEISINTIRTRPSLAGELDWLATIHLISERKYVDFKFRFSSENDAWKLDIARPASSITSTRV